ncbi:hypothetical protein UR09_00670 [Candidatus Nitromaritima sp. SCGC AAA799-A02]|nr:hypothetical protein UR09_00670 [Candidatus Nitromaritima sp. SCGC AAA799-A02]
MKCPSCEYINFKIVSKCSNCGYDYKKLKKDPPRLHAREGFTVFAGILDPALVAEEPEIAVAAAEESPAVDLEPAVSVEESGDFDLDLSDAMDAFPEADQETPQAVAQEAEPAADLMDDSALSADFDEVTDMDISDIEVEGLGFEGMDLGNAGEVAIETEESPEEEAVLLDLGEEPAPVAEELALSPEPDVEEDVSLDLGEDVGAVELNLDEGSDVEVTDDAEMNLEPEAEDMELSVDEEVSVEIPAEEEPPATEIEFSLEGEEEPPAVTKEPDTAVPEIEDLGLEIELDETPPPEEPS